MHQAAECPPGWVSWDNAHGMMPHGTTQITLNFLAFLCLVSQLKWRYLAHMENSSCKAEGMVWVRYIQKKLAGVSREEQHCPSPDVLVLHGQVFGSGRPQKWLL